MKKFEIKILFKIFEWTETQIGVYKILLEYFYNINKPIRTWKMLIKGYNLDFYANRSEMGL